MQNKKVNEFTLISVPKDVLEDAGIVDGSVLQIYADGNRLVIERLTDTGEIVCDGDCDNCPVNETECDENCIE
ncbi:MAG: AbrB/MazE/SpoVT family DNA-binding domain-containing protein [Candidatus Borkfalkiaceae bacterium]|nr:AbrB/MazE/SpoVT family DNA-binding domain-containing protein [Christensenellaceae bacterium]